MIAQELSGLGDKVRGLETRMAEVEKVNARLEDAALTTARALQEISSHWNAVYEAMRREEEEDSGSSSQRDHVASKARRQPEAAPHASGSLKSNSSRVKALEETPPAG